MELRVSLPTSIHIFISFVIATVSSSPLSSSSSSSTFSIQSDNSRFCEPVTVDTCAKIYGSTLMPNVYGDFSQAIAGEKLNDVIQSFSEDTSVVLTFLCTLYIPPCSEKAQSKVAVTSTVTPLPCRSMCELASEEARGLLGRRDHEWPVKCHSLPTENCYNYGGPSGITFVKKSIKATQTLSPTEEIISFAPLDVELGNDENYEVEVVSLSTSKIPARRYDIADLGDPTLFHGWADVQGSGAANDYCRVIGKGKRRFLSCNLAGSTGQGHQYVSKLGFEAGHPDTWFMRDMDGDGRDDYCRCVGSKTSSKIACMKAGDKGFYGSTTQGGNQNTFTLPVSGSCHTKKLNPMFGE